MCVARAAARRVTSHNCANCHRMCICMPVSQSLLSQYSVTVTVTLSDVTVHHVTECAFACLFVAMAAARCVTHLPRMCICMPLCPCCCGCHSVSVIANVHVLQLPEHIRPTPPHHPPPPSRCAFSISYVSPRPCLKLFLKWWCRIVSCCFVSCVLFLFPCRWTYRVSNFRLMT